MKINIFFKSLVCLAFFLGNAAKAQVVADEFRYPAWTARFALGNYSQATSAGTWYITRGTINPWATSSTPFSGFIGLSNPYGGQLPGTLVTPAIPKGGAKAISVRLATPQGSDKTVTRVLLEKSINNGEWQAIATQNVPTTSTFTAYNYTFTVNDYSDNLRFRVSSIAGKAIYIDRLVVSHSFNLSSNNTSVCPNTLVTLSAESSAPFTYTWTSSTGGNLQQTTGATVTATPSQTATYTATGTYTNAFGTFTDVKVINVNTNATPTATLSGNGVIDTEPGSSNLLVELTGTAPWSISYTANGGEVQTITGITNSPYILTVSPQVDTTYELTEVSDAICTDGTVTGISSVEVNKTVWRNNNGTINWTNGAPNASKNTYIQEPYITANEGVFIAKNLTVDNNGSLTISPNTVIIADQFINASTADKFVVESDANLMQSSQLTNQGNITVKRIANMAKMHYTFWGSPVSNQNLYAFSDGGLVGGTPKNGFMVYNESNDYFVNTGLNDAYTFRVGQGYAIRGKDSYSTNFNATSPYTFSFVGIPNNGNLAYQNLKWTNADHGFNLVGNPYPSNLDFDALYDANNSKIYGTAYFWTNQQYIPSQQGSDYEGSNYAIYNRSGGIPATFQDGVASPTPTQYIKVGQGFLVQSMAGSNNQPLQFTNAMRSYNASSIFFNKNAADNNVEKDRYWLNLKSPSNINNTLLVSYVQGATDKYENLYDADVLFVGSDAFYSKVGSSKLAIQGKAYPLKANDVVTLGARFYQSGNYTINIKNKEGIFNNDQVIYLKDKKLNKIINLSEEGEYTFAANKGTDDSRFEIVYLSTAMLSAKGTDQSKLIVVNNNDEWLVRNSQDEITAVEVYDASGKLVRSLSNLKTKEVKVNNLGLLRGVYILKITTTKGIKTEKALL